MKDLAKVVSIKEIWDLPNKDRVQGCNFNENGFEAMVGKDIKVGDLVVFIQEGSILPLLPQWEFLRKRCYREQLNGFLIKPQKFCDIKSWGLVVPLQDLPLMNKNFNIGEDLTDLLKIRKYEPIGDENPTKQSKSKLFNFLMRFRLFRRLRLFFVKNESGVFPTHLISKSDEILIQNNPDILRKYYDEKVYISAKMEGQSFTCLIEKKGNKLGKFYVCSRNQAYKKEVNNVFWNCAKKYNIEDKIRSYYERTGKLLIIQGEQVGVGIQENIYNLKGNEWYVYTIKDEITGKQLNVYEMFVICEELRLKTVPIIETNVELNKYFSTIKDCEEYAEKVCWEKIDNSIQSYINLNNIEKKLIQHEGIVVRSMNYDRDNNIGFSFKVKNIDYAEKGLKKLHKMCIGYFGD